MADEILATHADYEANEKKWTRVIDAVAGGDEIKNKRDTYLPRPGGQEDDDYAAYIARARWYDVTDRTLVGLVGAIFRREPQIEAPNRFKDQLDDLSVTGSPWITTTREIAQAVLSVGRVGVLVDRPPEEQSVGVVPNVSLYSAIAIRDWKVEKVKGRQALTRVVLEEEDDKSGRQDQLQYRELVMNDGKYEQRIWRKTTGVNFEVDETVVPLKQGKALDFIPFVVINPTDLNADVKKPPLLGLTDENIGHYQVVADYRQSLFLTSQPTPWVAGATEDERPSAIGSGVAWFFENPEAKVGMLEFTGAGIGALRQALLDSEVRMVLLGARFFEEQKKAAETSETTRLRFSSTTASLMTIASTIGEGTTKILQWSAEWAGLPSETIVQTMNDDFVALPLTPAEIEAYLKAWQGKAIAYTDLYALLKRGDVIAEDRDEEDVLSDIETTPPEIPPTDDADNPDDDEEEDEEGSQAA